MENDSPKTITAQEVLDEASAIRSTRGNIYGSPVRNHRRIAELWSTYLDTHITPDQVAICMALTKISRLAQTAGHANRDSYVDLVAYAALSAEIATSDQYAD
jgi:hypothetical protein